MSSIVAKRRAATRLLGPGGVDVLRLYKAANVDAYGDARGEDLPAVAGAAVTFRGVPSSMRTSTAGSTRSIFTPVDIRRELGHPPDEVISVEEVNPDGSSIPGEFPVPLLGSPRPSVELATRQGTLLTVLHIGTGSPP